MPKKAYKCRHIWENMDGDDASDAMGGLHDVGGSGGSIEARMEDGDSGTSTLQSLGYVENGPETSREGGKSPDSWISTFKTAVMALVAVFLGLSLLYLFITSILFMFGVTL